MKSLFLVMAFITLFYSVCNASHANSDRSYIALLSQAAADMNLSVSAAAKRCVLRAIPKIPDSIKQKAVEIHSIDAQALRNAGVSESDLRLAIKTAQPCIDQIAAEQNR